MPRRAAEPTQERRYAEDFVWRMERGAGGELSLIFEECAVDR